MSHCFSRIKWFREINTNITNCLFFNRSKYISNKIFVKYGKSVLRFEETPNRLLFHQLRLINREREREERKRNKTASEAMARHGEQHTTWGTKMSLRTPSQDIESYQLSTAEFWCFRRLLWQETVDRNRI